MYCELITLCLLLLPAAEGFTTSKYTAESTVTSVPQVEPESNERIYNERQFSQKHNNITMEEFIEKHFHKSTYNKHVRPNINEGKPIEINIDMYIKTIGSIDEMNMEFSVDMFFRQRWLDKRLAYTEYDVPVPINFDLYDSLWVPDTNFKEMKAGHLKSLTVPNRLLRLYPDGQIYYSQGLLLLLDCHMDLAKYPMDTQACSIKIGSYGFTTDDLIVQWRNISEPVQMATIELAEFTLSHQEYGDCSQVYITGTFSCQYVKLVFDRKFNYYLIQVYIPSILIVILSWVSFWIDIDAVPARVSLGLLTVLTMTTQASSVTSRTPRVSYVKAMDVWMIACLLFVFGSLGEYCIVNVLYRHDKKAKADKKQRMSTLMGVANSAFLVGQNAAGHKKEHSLEDGERLPEQNIVTLSKRAPPQHLPQFHSKKPHCPFWDRKHYKNRNALYVDVMSRYLFPGAFAVFVIAYWISYKCID